MGGEEVQLVLILNLSTRWGWVVSVKPRPRFTPGERTPGTHWTGGWVGTRAGLDAGARGKILCPCRGSNPDRPGRSQSLYWLSYCGSIKQKKRHKKTHRSGNLETRNSFQITAITVLPPAKADLLVWTRLFFVWKEFKSGGHKKPTTRALRVPRRCMYIAGCSEWHIVSM
jgi:hypothetical protein